MVEYDDSDIRICFIDPSRLVRIVDESDAITTEIVPTDDPEKFIMRITGPAPRFMVKEAVIV